MCRFLSLLLLPVLSLPVWIVPAWAADEPTACVAPAHAHPSAHAERQTWQQHFTGANVAHDGHLTPEEAKAGYPDLAKHFEDIDVDHKGYVTETDVRDWRLMRRTAHRLSKPSEDRLIPRSAVHHVYPDFKTVPVARRQTVAASAGSVAAKP
jgi:hypothetical protein